MTGTFHDVNTSAALAVTVTDAPVWVVSLDNFRVEASRARPQVLGSVVGGQGSLSDEAQAMAGATLSDGRKYVTNRSGRGTRV